MQAIFSNVHRECNVRNDAAQAGAGMMMWFISSSAFANEIRFNMTRGATAISQQVYDLHMTIFYICCVIGLLVFGIMFWSMWYMTHIEPASVMTTRVRVKTRARKIQPPSDLVFMCRK